MVRGAARPAAIVYDGRMQPHERHDPEANKPDPRDKRAKWLLLAICILLGLIVSQIAKRFL